jgi:hypothetical protein
MAARTQNKLSPLDTWSLRGTDRRGASAALSAASDTGITISGHFSDQADFTVPLLFKRDDLYGYGSPNGIGATRYMPDGSLSGMILDADVAITGAFSPLSIKYDSINAGKLSYTLESGVGGTLPLSQFVMSTVGGAPASLAITITGIVAVNDLFYIVFLGNQQALYQATALSTVDDVASGLTLSMNTGAIVGQSICPFAVWNGTYGLTIYAGRSATPTQYTLTGNVLILPQGPLGFWGNQIGDVVMFANSGAMEKHTITTWTSPWSVTLDSVVTITPTIAMWPLYHEDGNSVQLWVATNSAATMSNAGFPKLTGGLSETSFHLTVPFTPNGIDSLFELWLTIGPHPTYDSGTVNPALVPFIGGDFSVVISNGVLTDPLNAGPLSVAGLGTVTVSSTVETGDATPNFAGTGWSTQTGFYLGGSVTVSPTVGDSVVINYSCQYTHDLYLGTVLRSDGGVFSVLLDNIAQPDISTLFVLSTPLVTRVLIQSGVVAGNHVVAIKVKTAGNCYFDYIQAAVLDSLIDPVQTYPNFSAACDFDTGQTGLLPPARTIDIMQRCGFQDDIDFFAGSIFPYINVRNGGFFHQATIVLSGSIVPGDSLFIDISSVVSGVGVTSLDTLNTLAQRCVNAINTLFVGVCAVAAGATITIIQLSPINGFTLSVIPGVHVVMTLTGDVNTGNEGTWQADASQTSPLTPALSAYLSDFCTIMQGLGQTLTIAFSQEIAFPPDVNTVSGAWSQRFVDGTQVLTATGFGSTGAGVIEALAAGVYKQTGHGYVTGNTGHFASGTGSGQWVIVVTDANHYTLGALITQTSGYTPGVGDQVFIDLQTTQCNFNPATVTAYMTNVYVQAANIMDAAGLVPWLQFGEVGWWFFSEYMSELIGYTSFTSPISIGTVKPHNLLTGQTVVVVGVRGTTAANGTWPFVKTDATHGTLTGSVGNGVYVAGTGTISGGGMAYYDAYTSSAANTALGRALANFWTQDDDPSINAFADASFLQNQIYTHIHTIWAAVLAAQGAAQAEWLLPLDVNYPSVYWNNANPYPQGGRLNNYVNLPYEYLGPGSDIARLKVESLSFGATYRSLDNVRGVAAFVLNNMTWPLANIIYLIPWFNGGCPWPKEYLLGFNLGVRTQTFAMDHLVLLSFELPLPVNKRIAEIS